MWRNWMIVCMIETYIACYIIYYDTWRAKQYTCRPDMLLFFDNCSQVVQSQNDQCRREMCDFADVI